MKKNYHFAFEVFSFIHLSVSLNDNRFNVSLNVNSYNVLDINFNIIKINS